MMLPSHRYWSAASGVLGLTAIFSNSRQVSALLEEEGKRWEVSFTPTSSPNGCPLAWSGLETAGAGFDPQAMLQAYLDTPTVAAIVDIDDDDPDDYLVVKITMDGRRDGRLPRCLWTVTVMNVQNVALAVSSAHTAVLSDGDDHAGSVPHAWPLIHAIKGWKDGSLKLNVRGKPRRVWPVASTDSVALYEQSNGSSALATFCFPQNGGTKHEKGDLALLLNVTHDAKTQDDMHERMVQPWLDGHPCERPVPLESTQPSPCPQPNHTAGQPPPLLSQSFKGPSASDGSCLRVTTTYLIDATVWLLL